MYEWIFAVQKLIDWIDDNVLSTPSLNEISKQVGYSPYYCSMQFHRFAGMSIRSYMAKRRLCMAAIEVRDTKRPLIDIAIDYGFSSQSALTRAFLSAYGCTPSAYRKKPAPVPLVLQKVVVNPSHYIKKGDLTMGNLVLPSYRIEYIPAHKYLGVYENSAKNYPGIWAGHDCDAVTGLVESIAKQGHPVITAHTAGWVWDKAERHYFYGLGVDADYSGGIPKGFELRGAFPPSYYLVFNHPAFDYLADNTEVMNRVEKLAWNFDPAAIGYEWNEDVCQDYQRHYPEGLGYQVLRPVKKISG